MKQLKVTLALAHGTPVWNHCTSSRLQTQLISLVVGLNLFSSKILYEMVPTPFQVCSYMPRSVLTEKL